MSDGHNGHTNGSALGDVARDVMDHASMIVRDRLELTRLEAHRYAEHVKKDVAPRAAFGAAAAFGSSAAARPAPARLPGQPPIRRSCRY